MSAYDLSNEEILVQYAECKGDPIKLWRVAVAHASRADMHKGIINNRHSDQYSEATYANLYSINGGAA